ncbi:hypothetical protein CXG81DRAFT_16692 [Caulochytrium protostelioides]|uniref:Uncharacterized protein n=1 Tax=Caulochytrium protostelioides TaxID=1555241 RepID=A0A4V1IVF3_9FUNG|nr:hypothetical protein CAUPRSCDRAFT_10316 [Caulochytrium protostelioides]RKP03859.1 hypothetical protein CXG81DRAFT_16692 [Caulochytrium protostelioides]|eukprot:RKP03859.1 hypothetical protein CXG81DRAFT_16692 [Caulochytrium protostelioides]
MPYSLRQRASSIEVTAPKKAANGAAAPKTPTKAAASSAKAKKGGDDDATARSPSRSPTKASVSRVQNGKVVKKAVNAQIAKRGVDNAIKALGPNPIHRIASTNVKTGLSQEALDLKSAPGAAKPRVADATADPETLRKTLAQEVKKLPAGKPSEVQTARQVADIKTAVNTQVLKHAIVKEIVAQKKE